MACEGVSRNIQKEEKKINPWDLQNRMYTTQTLPFKTGDE